MIHVPRTCLYYSPPALQLFNSKKNYFNYDADDDDETPLQNMFFLKCCLLDSLTQTVSLSLSTTTHIIYLQFLNKIKDCILYSQKQMQIYLCVLYTI